MSTIQSPLDAGHARAHFAFYDQASEDALSPVYLDSAATSHRPRVVTDAVLCGMTTRNANIHRASYRLAQAATEAFEGARATIGRFIGAPAQEVVFTKNATEALNLLARCLPGADASWRLGAGKSVLLTEMEHASNVIPWQMAASSVGAQVRFLPLTADGLLDLARLPELLDHTTQVVAITHASNMVGTFNDLSPIIERAREVGAVVVVDASQSVPHRTVDVGSLGADFMVFTGHKMCGPTGIGVLWGRGDLLAALPPFLGGGDMFDDLTSEGMLAAAPPRRFEAGTPPLAEALGLAAAADFLTRVGLANLHAHDQLLCAHAMERLHADPRIRILGPTDPAQRGSVVAFTVDGVDPGALARLLDDRGIAVRAGQHCAQLACRRLNVSSSVRLSTYLYNTVDEIDHLVNTIATTLKETT
ncbi:aminotransferase class V-fold PLP-dependent enzyme [Streptomyces sp. NPDC059698]|uniref:aminotransferase class V-fold PLP-dependent enzyme n=1 Tax=Streptomyces TaxID=1883 RepID=UPI00093C7827|nr:aminotransferase class V-fold PLP-dependent enzyme [Streptomyces sp. CB02366]